MPYNPSDCAPRLVMDYVSAISITLITLIAWHIAAVLIIKSRLSEYRVDPFMDIFRILIISDIVMTICLVVVLWAF